ncbi:MAG: hypothetical protein AAFX93_04855 [Verrucomicrobiota bacterium]
MRSHYHPSDYRDAHERAPLSYGPELPQDSYRLYGKRILIGVAFFSMVCGVAYYMMQQVAVASIAPDAAIFAEEPTLKIFATENLPDLNTRESPEELLTRITISSIRLAGEQSRIVVDGTIHTVGDIINEEVGLIFVGHDPDAEYLLFKDTQENVLFFSLNGWENLAGIPASY